MSLTKANTRMLEGDLPASQITGELPVGQVPTIPNSKLENSSVTINGSAVALGGSTTIAGGTNSPAFSAYKGSNGTLASATAVFIGFDTELFDPDGTYDISTYRFTPAVAGYYYLSATVSVAGLNSQATTELSLYKNGSTELKRYLDVAVNSSSTRSKSISISGVFYLSATDYVSTRIYTDLGSSTTIKGGSLPMTTFEGFKLA